MMSMMIMMMSIVGGWGYELPRVPFYFPIGRADHFRAGLKHVQLYEDPLVVYRNPMTGFPVIHSDICPHMGAQLHHGWIGDNGGLHCPYHGFEFDQDGMFCNIPNPVKQYKRHESRICLPTYPTLEKHGYLFVPGEWPSPSVHHPVEAVAPTTVSSSAPSSSSMFIWPKTFLPPPSETLVGYTPYFPPEEQDPSFRCIHGQRTLPQYQDIITENLLDMLHISYVHSFGNRLAPIPYEVRSEAISPWAHRTRFMYTPNSGTISTEIGRVNRVIVENEIHMPSTTITRVIAGKLIKTVHTMTQPLNGQSSILYWRIYRNFWRDPYFPHFDRIGDATLRFFMEKTIDEDRDILGKIDAEHRFGNLYTKYDQTIRRYREMMARFSRHKEFGNPRITSSS